jgi:hypothetical protein
MIAQIAVAIGSFDGLLKAWLAGTVRSELQPCPVHDQKNLRQRNQMKVATPTPKIRNSAMK